MHATTWLDPKNTTLSKTSWILRTSPGQPESVTGNWKSNLTEMELGVSITSGQSPGQSLCLRAGQ